MSNYSIKSNDSISGKLNLKKDHNNGSHRTFIQRRNKEKRRLGFDTDVKFPPSIKDLNLDSIIANREMVDGYTLNSKMPPYTISLDTRYRAIDNVTLKKVMIKYSPYSLEQTTPLSKFLNEWFILSGLNPKQPDPKWMDSVSNFGNLLPVSLPRDIPGILYPIDFFYSKATGASALIYDNELELTNLVEKFIIGDSDGPKFLDERSSSNTSLRSIPSTHFHDISQKLVHRSSTEVIEILKIIIEVLKTLKKVHDLGFTNNGLTTLNIFVDKNDNVFIEGWDFAFSRPFENCTKGYRATNKDLIAWVLPYASPEATGHFNKLCDYKSDFYSLGIIMYELLVGFLPFQSTDVSKIISAHIYQTPISPYVISSWVPQRLSDVVMKCLEKLSINRFNDCNEIINEITLCVAELTGNSITDLDYPYKVTPRFLYPKNTYNRKADLVNLIQKFETAPQGVSRIYITGEKGAGKSSILGDFKTYLVGKRAVLYAERHHKQFRNCDSNYNMFVSIIRQILSQIIRSGLKSIKAWRNAIIREVDDDLRLVQDTFPELKQIVGVKHLAITKEQQFMGENQLDMLPAKFESRFEYLIKMFFSLFASFYPEGLTILLDDDQFQTKNERLFFDEIINFMVNHNHSKKKAKMRIISTLLEGSGLRGEYQSFVSLTPDSLVSDDTKNYYVKLSPLTLEAVKEFISDFMPLIDIPMHGHISEMVYEVYLYHKTPLVLRCSMDKLILSETLQIKNGKAVFDFKKSFKLANKNLTEYYDDCVGSFLLNDKTNILKYAACICSGNSFSLHHLSVLSGLSISDTYSALFKAIAVSLILPLGIDYKVPFHLISKESPLHNISEEEITKIASTCLLEFSHDTLQDYILGEVMGEEELKIFHRLCALRMYDDVENLEDLNYSRLIHVTRHFIESIDVATEEDTQTYSEVLIYGGTLAYHNYDFDLALLYFQAAKKFGDIESEEDDIFGRSRRLDLTIVQLQFIIGNYEDCMNLVDELTLSYDCPLDKVSFLMSKLKSLFALGRLDEGIEVSLESLRMFGIDIQMDEKWNEEYQEKIKPRVPLSVAQIRSLALNRADPTDTNYFVKAEVIATLIVPLISNSYGLLSKTILYIGVVDIIENGYLPSHAWILMGLAIIIVKDEHEVSFMRAIEYTSASLKMIEDNETSLELGTSIYEIYCGSMALYCEPIEVVFKYIDVFVGNNRAYINSYFDINPFMSVGIKNVISVIAGTENLSSILLKNSNPEFDNNLASTRESNKAWIEMGTNFLQCLIGRLSPSDFKQTHYDDQYFVLKQNDYVYFIMKFFISYLLGDQDNALEYLSEVIPRSETLFPVTCYKIVIVYCGALLLMKSPGESDTDKAKRSKLLNEYMRYMDIWSTTCPSTFKTKNMLVQAVWESKSSCHTDIDILDMFELVIEKASSKGQLFDQALACELCSEWLLESSSSKTRAAKFMKEALRLYDLWGCSAKVARLSEEYHELVHNYNWAGLDILSPSSETASPSLTKSIAPFQLLLSSFFSQNDQAIHTSGDETEETEETSFRRSSSDTPLVDMKAALNTCLAISEAVDSKIILAKLVESTSALIDADFAVVALKDKAGNLYLECAVSNQKVRIIDHEPLLSRNDICPVTLIQEVFDRGRIINREDDPILFDNKFTDEDIYFQTNPSLVAVCIPIKDQNEVVGAMYLENQHQPKQRTKCFTSEKIDIAVLFCTQLAFSLYKAGLYQLMDLAAALANAATEEKANFLNSMSHEIRTPFNSLLSCALFLLDTELTDSQRDYVETIKNSSMVTLNIIDGILSFAKIENTSVTLDELPFSINDCIESALQLVSEQASTKNLELIHINYCEDIDIILGDITRFRQVIVNIVGNAVKFTSQGHILVETKCHKVSLDNRYEFNINVKDTGIGIPKDSHNKVFGAFSQVDGSARRVYGGAGLGLAISKKIVDIMGGSLTFESEENKGTTFTFSLIVKLEQNTRKISKIGGGKAVLIVESDELTSFSLKHEISSYGYQVMIFESFEKFLEALKQKEFSVVFFRRKLINENNELDLDLLIKKHNEAKFILMGPFGTIHNKNFDRILLLPFMKLKLYEILMPSNRVSDEKTRLLTKKSMQNLLETHPLKILLAEDNMINTKVTLLHLKRMGYKLDHAADGLIALEKCAIQIKETGKNYDVILMDIQMPNMDGIESCKKLMELYLDSHLKPEVIALTANVVGEDRQRCVASGMSNFISKPLLPNDLAQLLLCVPVKTP